MVYDGATLSMTVTDPSTSPASKFTTTFPIDIPAHVGGPTGWVGFTGSTGGLTEPARDPELDLHQREVTGLTRQPMTRP